MDDSIRLREKGDPHAQEDPQFTTTFFTWTKMNDMVVNIIFDRGSSINSISYEEITCVMLVPLSGKHGSTIVTSPWLVRAPLDLFSFMVNYIYGD